MSTTETTRPATRPTAPSSTTFSQDDCPTEIIPVVAPAAPVPVRRSILHAASAQVPAASAHRERSPFADWRDATPTEELPAVQPARPRVSTPAKPTRGREARRASRTAPTGTKGLRRQHPHLARHLRAALAGLLIAAALLTGLQLYAAAGISSARQAALAERDAATASAAPLSGQSTYTPASHMSGQSDPKPDWVTEHTGAAYDRTNPAASPLDLPRCTTSPDTPLPCLATISPSQTRAVVLEEDASLTPLVRR